VKLRVTTAGGCNSANRVIEVDVKPKPLARFDFSDTACLPNAKILFNNTSTIADGTTNAMSYTWNFGEPSTGLLNTSTSINPTHYYQNLGPYLVKLLVRSNVGCIDDTIITINTIHPRPDADFSFSKPSVCIGDNIQMFDISNTQDGTLLNWYWDFGDGGNDIIRNPVHTFADTGLYLISHYIKNSFGCMSDTMIKPLNIYPYPQISAGPDIRILEGLSGALEATAVGTNLEYLWASSTFLNNPLVLNPVCTPTRDIHYLLTVKGIGGCSSTDDVNVILLKSPLIPNTFSPNGDGINDLWKIEYLNQYPNARVQVFARTGQLVFESKNGYLKAWDGTYNGKPLLVDTYYYIIEPASGRDPITGYITILK
jgi:gliding motility-associated-like protein